MYVCARACVGISVHTRYVYIRIICVHVHRNWKGGVDTVGGVNGRGFQSQGDL